MFFGTSAKVYFLSAALLGWLRATSAMTATDAPRIFLISLAPSRFVLSLHSGPTEHAGSVGLPSADLFEQNRENDEDANEGALPVGIDAGHQQAVADDLDQGGADE